MRYLSLKDLTAEEFSRLTRAKPTTFRHRAEILDAAHKGKRGHGGRSSKLCVEDQLWMMLEYLRE
jgi:uncharacterized Fe-S cluster-containing radical SAM superfamily protein